MTRILLTRFGGVGDLLFIEPTIRALYKKHYPCEIVFRTYRDYEGVLDYHPCISDVVYDTANYYLGYRSDWTHDGISIAYKTTNLNDNLSSRELEWWGDAICNPQNVNPHFDYHFDFHGICSIVNYFDSTEVHAARDFANHANVKLNDIVPQVHYLKRDTPSYPLVVQLISAGGDRCLAKNQQVLDSLSKYKPYFIGEEKLEYSHLVSIINNCDLFVGTESCGVIIARGLNKKVIGLYKNKARIKNRAFDKMETLSFDEIYKLEKTIAVTLPKTEAVVVSVDEKDVKKVVNKRRAADTTALDSFFNEFMKERHDIEHGKWKEIRDKVIKPLVSQDIFSKTVSDEFAGMYVHGGEKEFKFEEHYAPFLSFRGYSKFRYPIYLFYADDANEDNEAVMRIKEEFSPVIIIPIPRLADHGEYSKFMIRQAFHEVEQEKIITFQDDGFFRKSGWEEFVNQYDFDYVGAPWPFLVNQQGSGYDQVCYDPEKYGIPKDVRVTVGNGGFSYRKKSKMIEVASKVADQDCNWKYDGNQLPEDTFFSYFGFGMNIFKHVPDDIASRFSREPYHENVDSFGFHRVL